MIRLGIVASLVFLVVIKVFSFFIKDKIKIRFFLQGVVLGAVVIA